MPGMTSYMSVARLSYSESLTTLQYNVIPAVEPGSFDGVSLMYCSKRCPQR